MAPSTSPSSATPASRDWVVDWLTPPQHDSLVDLLCELHAHYNQPPTATRDAVRHHLQDNLLSPSCGMHLLVASDSAGMVVGLAALVLMHSLVEPGPDQRRQCLLKELFVRAHARGQGVGEALVRRAAEFALYSGCGRMDWNVKASNLRGIAFYEALGGRRVEDRLSFRWPLEALSRLAQAR